MKTAAVLGLLCLTLTGCWSNNTSRNINLVKQSVYSGIQNGVTVGEALNNRKICKKPIWIDTLNDIGDPVVEYRCELVDYKSFYTSVNKEHLNDKLAKVQESRYNAVRMISEGEERLTELGYRSMQFDVFKNAVYYIKEKGLAKSYKQATRKLGIKNIDYRFIFDERRKYKITNPNNKTQANVAYLENLIQYVFKNYGIEKEYYDTLGLNLSLEYGKDILNLSDVETINYFERAHMDINRKMEDIRKEVDIHREALYQLRFANEIVEDYVPKKVEQVVRFNIITGRPVPYYCNFEFDSIPKTEENTSIHFSYCLKMTYDKDYNESFKQLFVEDFENKLSRK